MSGRAVGESLAAILFLTAVGFAVAHCLAGCALFESQAAKEAAAEGAYATEHMACVDRYPTNAEIDACREGVRRRWGITTTVTKDAGADR